MEKVSAVTAESGVQSLHASHFHYVQYNAPRYGAEEQRRKQWQDTAIGCIIGCVIAICAAPCTVL